MLKALLMGMGVNFDPVGHGARVPGGISIGAGPGKPYSFIDGKKGYLVVSPASQRKASISWGLWNFDTRVHNVSSEYSSDWNTGAYNTDILMSPQYATVKYSYGSVGSPAARACKTLSFESCTDFFLPNKDELHFVKEHQALIDSLDETGAAFPNFKLSNWGFGSGDGPFVWSSTEKAPYNAWDVSIIKYRYHGKNLRFGVIPCRRIIIE